MKTLNWSALLPLGTSIARSLSALLIACAVLVAGTAQAAKGKYEVLRWAEDWSYLESEGTKEGTDRLKNVDLGGDWRLDFGGSFRLRFEEDDNRPLNGTDDSMLRLRSFLHLSLYNGKRFRFFVEGRYSDTISEERGAGAIFRDDPDFQNFFLEFTAASETAHPFTVRVGRQELLLGAQRLVSPLNWSSTRRTFDGISLTSVTPRTKTVGFATYPVAHEINDIDSPIDEVLFAGVHFRFKPKNDHSFEGYIYRLDDDRDTYTSEEGGDPDDMERNTLGFRYIFARDGWKFETELAYQGGDKGGDDIDALMASGTVAYTWKDLGWKPSLSFGLDHASGDSDPTDGDAETFSQLFPLGHAYFGHIDLQGRQNVQAARLQLVVKPRKGLKWVTALHRFRLDEDKDALYTAGGGPKFRDTTGDSGSSVATELDMLLAYGWNKHHSVAFEFTRYWGGSFVEEQAGRDDSDAWFAWLAYEFRF